MKNKTESLNEVSRFDSFPQIFGKMRDLALQYGDLPVQSIVSAFAGSGVNGFGNMYTPNPYIQNRRVKEISSLPGDYKKDDVAKMLTKPDSNEMPLRQVAHTLEFTSYPMFHTRKTYQSLLTYHNYIAPHLSEKEDAKDDRFWREWRLLEKLRDELEIKATTQMIFGQALVEGKVFYIPQIKVDKAHNRVEHAFLQQLPSDWTKIVGFNNKSKYTVAFNLMYFLKPGTDFRQFGDLFLPYISDFAYVTDFAPNNRKAVYSSKVDMDALHRLENARPNGINGNPDIYYQNGRWFYWVNLPADKVFTFEVDNVSRNAISPFAGLFLNVLTLSTLSQIQLELYQNPLVAIMHGEIPYFDDKTGGNAPDQYKLSNAGRELFLALWQQLLSMNNTSGIGFYAAPFQGMKLESLPEAPGATNITAQGYEDTINQAGLTGIIPTSSQTRAGMAQISLSIESKFGEPIYHCMERMMKTIIEGLNLKYSWRFKMFGNLATDADEDKNLRNDMTLGILPATIRYLALHDMSIFDDISISMAVKESGVLDYRLPLVSSYSAKQGESNLPPQIAHEQNPGGHPEGDGNVTSDGNEGDLDSPGSEV